MIKVSQGYLYMVDTYDIGDKSRRTYIVTVDINGSQPPNMFGIDIFRMTYGYNISSKKHYLFHMSNYYNYNREALLRNDCNKNKTGNYCGALIEIDGWQIKEDYPWK